MARAMEKLLSDQAAGDGGPHWRLKLNPHHVSLDLKSDVIRLVEVRKVTVGLRS